MPFSRSGLLPPLLFLALAACSAPDDTAAPPVRPFAAPASFLNGGFEDDMPGSAPSAWTLTTYRNAGLSVVPPTKVADLNLQAGGAAKTWVLGGATESQPDAQAGMGATLRYPRYGSRAVVINDLGNGNNVNSLKQSATVGAGDVDPDDGRVHVRFVTAAVMDASGHDPMSQAYFYIEARNTTRGTILFTDFNYGNQPGVPWKPVGGYLYKDWQLVDVSGDSSQLAPGDTVELELVASGCSGGGHFLKLYVDGVGATIDSAYAVASAPAYVKVGQDLTYDIRYKNGGGVSVDNATVQFSLPPGTTFVSLSAPGATAPCAAPAVGAGGSVVCNFGTLASGAGGTYQVTVHVGGGVGGAVASGDYWITADAVSPLYGTKAVTQVLQPASVAASAGGGQSAAVHAGFATPLSVIVRDQAGNPFEGATVAFTAGDNHGATALLASASAVTDAQGLATVTATASDVAGTYSVTAQVQGVPQPATLTLTNLPGPPSTIAAQPGATPQTAQVDTGLGAPLAVLVRDAYGNVVPGVQVQFAAPETGPSAVLSAASAQSDALGVASVTAKAGKVAGDYNVTASASGVVPPALFALSNQAGPPGKITITNGDGQSTGVASVFPQRLGVLVTDAFDNALPGQRVAFRAPVTGPTALLRALYALTDAQGRASVAADAATEAGRYAVSASVRGVAQPAVFQLNNHAGAPAAIVADWRSAYQCAAPGQEMELVATVRDRYKNAVPGVPVIFSASDEGLLLSTKSAASDVDGRVRVVARSGEGVEISPRGAAVYAAADGVALPARFPLSVAQPVEPAATISRVAGSGQSARVGEPFKLALRVRASGRVTFVGPDSGPGAVFSAREATPDPESGIAMVTARANGVAGHYIVKAILSDCGDSGQVVSFALSNLPGAPASVRVEDALATPQAAQAGGAFRAPLTVVVRDASGNPVPGVDVTFAAPAAGAGALLDATTLKTGASGRASVNANATSQTGEYAVTVTAAGVDQPARFALANTAAAPREVEIVDGTLQSTLVIAAYGTPLSVLVRDAAGAPLVDVPVTFTPFVAAGRQSVTPAAQEVRTDAQGRASVTLTANQARGPVLVAASAAGAAAPVPFLVTNLPVPTGISLTAIGRGGGTAALPTGTVDLRAGVEAVGVSALPTGQVLIFGDDGMWAVVDGNVAAEQSGRAGIEGSASTTVGTHHYQAVFLPSPDDAERGSETFAPSMSEVQTVDIAPPAAPPAQDFDGCQCRIGSQGAGAGAAPPTTLLLVLGALLLVLRGRLRAAVRR